LKHATNHIQQRCNTFDQTNEMNKYKLNILTILLLIPIFSIGQIPKGHFLDADSTEPRGMKIKPFINNEMGIYHYELITKLHFENDCNDITGEREKYQCAERNLRKLIFEKIDGKIEFKGNVYAYLTVTKGTEITDISVRSYPKSEVINQKILEGIEKINVKVGKYKGLEVTTRLWTSFSFPSSFQESFQESVSKMKADENPKYERYESLLFDATQYIFSGPIYPKGSEFQAAVQIVNFWMNKDTGMNIPTFGDFFTSLTNENQQQFLYTVAMINYGLNQKINHARILKCKKTEGQKYSEQKDVREVQLRGAEILLEFISNEKNKVPMTSKTKKYFKAFKKSKLNEKLFK
jgi:hypothetical protein